MRFYLSYSNFLAQQNGYRLAITQTGDVHRFTHIQFPYDLVDNRTLVLSDLVDDRTLGNPLLQKIDAGIEPFFSMPIPSLSREQARILKKVDSEIAGTGMKIEELTSKYKVAMNAAYKFVAAVPLGSFVLEVFPKRNGGPVCYAKMKDEVFSRLSPARKAIVVEAINGLKSSERPEAIPGFVLKEGAFVPA